MIPPTEISMKISQCSTHSTTGMMAQSHPIIGTTIRPQIRSVKSLVVYWTLLISSLIVSCLLANNLVQSQQQQTEIYSIPPTPGSVGIGIGITSDQLPVTILPPIHLRPKVHVNIREWTRKLSEDIRAVGNKTSCSFNIEKFFEKSGEFQQLDPIKLRDNIINQTSLLLSQHRAAVNAIVTEAEKAVVAHVFNKSLRVNYTDVHRLRNEAEQNTYNQLDLAAQQALDQSMGSSGASGSGPGSQTPQFTSIGGGTPVPGPAEWQTPVKSIYMQLNRNFGDIPVNTSMSAVHLPLPIYAGQPEIMNGIAWTEKLDQVFRRNLAQYAHVHHQYYGDHLGFLRTFPAHKWRIARTDPDLFDARTRPWYVTGASSPKDVVILVDTSGSMTGLRREIAKGVVFEILDTLTNQDFFAVMRFSETATLVGLPKCPNLRTPKMTPELEEQCSRADLYPLGNQQGYSPLGIPSGGSSSGMSTEERIRQIECTNFFKQQENRGQYLRDHPNHLQQATTGAAGGNLDNRAGSYNFSYLSDDAYQTSIGNVTNDIRDAYMLPATSRNIRYLKSNFTMPTAGIANFTHALMAAFELLQAYNRSGDFKSSECNQAIMLITDGAIRSNDELFNRYNYPNSPIRVFTYMIGREVGDVSHTKAMACNNRGYYTHVINLGEIREQVQKYPPVMARPLVLSHHHPVIWTSAYGDETHQVLTDWVLEIKRRERARIMLNEERERLYDSNSSDFMIIELTNIPEYDEQPLVDKELMNRIICEDTGQQSAPDSSSDPEQMLALEQSLHDELDPLGYNELGCHWSLRRADLLTSVVKPVYDNRNATLMFQRILSKNIWTEKETHVRNAQLLGVASVDIRIADILKAAPSYLLGSNGYAILMGPSGFMLHHPDLRALLEDPFDKHSKILKPYFNAVDLTHVEQVYHKNESSTLTDHQALMITRRTKNDDMKLLKLREAAIRRQTGTETINVKRAIDCRRRPHIRQQTFYYGPIKDTPYSFMVALPQNYGPNRVEARMELNKQSAAYLVKPTAYDLWTVHPDYKYCEASGWRQNASSVSVIVDVLEWAFNGNSPPIPTTAAAAGAASTLSGGPTLPPLTSVSFEQLSNLNDASHNRPPNSVVCDQDLFGSLLFDAAATYEKLDSYCGSASIDPNCDRHQSSFSFYTGARDNDDSCARTPNEMRSKLASIYGLEMSFLATRSGLTRVRVFDLSPRIKKLADLFIQRHNRAIDESWYSRTVDWNMRQEDATVITAPYNAYIRLIAKLRQRITQRHPAANDTRANCDPALDSDSETSSSIAPEQAAAATSIQNDDNQVTTSESSSSENPNQAGQDQQAGLPPTMRINYNEYSSYDFLDLLVNSSVHISATQTAIAKRGDKSERSPVAVTGLLYDYATFARRFLNATSLNIRTLDRQQQQQQPASSNNFASSSLHLSDTGASSPGVVVDICPNGECPTKCGYRNDTIDCLLVDNNGYIIVGEDLPHIGRSLVDYDEKLMASLVEHKIYHKIQIMDYQAICQRSDAEQLSFQQRATSLLSSMNTNNPNSAASSSGLHSRQSSSVVTLELLGQVLSNFAAALVYIGSMALTMLTYQAGFNDLSEHVAQSIMGQPMPWQLGSSFASAQSAIANQSLLAMLPNKTYLRPCERLVTLYELYPKLPSSDTPEYYATKCNCSGWYVFDQIPKTNLIMLIVNTTSACRRGCDPSPPISSSSSVSNNGIIIPTTATTNPLDNVPSSSSGGQNALPNQNQQQPFVGNKTAEDQVCAMLERDAQLYWKKPETCYAQHPEESQIHLCGGAHTSLAINLWLMIQLMMMMIGLLATMNSSRMFVIVEGRETRE